MGRLMRDDSGPVGFVTEWSCWPTGCDPLDPDNWDCHAFQVTVTWRGRPYRGGGGYAVTQGPAYVLSRAGKWAWCPPKFKARQYRWATLEEAQAWALRVVDDYKVNGRTWAEWQRKSSDA